MTHKDCYGKIFPEFSSSNAEKGKLGTVFSYDDRHLGLTPPKHIARVDHQAWDKCMKCEEFDHCYKLSTALLLFHCALDKS